MKRTSLILIAVFALVMLPAAFAQSHSAQDPSQQPRAHTPSQNPSAQSPSAGETPGSPSSTAGDTQHSFVGSIMKDASGKYVLHAGSNDYQLDDQSSAGKFDGNSVKVTGQLDQTSNTIRVQSIEPSSSM